MKPPLAILAILASAVPLATLAEDFDGFEGPGRFCGYSAIIDLRPGERIFPTQGGIHGGRFEWEGAFGKLEVVNIGWAAKPDEEPMPARTGTGQTQFPEVHGEDGYSKKIWDRANGVAVFSSRVPLTEAQLEAVDRVGLFTEGEQPENCKYSTVFSWDVEEE